MERGIKILGSTGFVGINLTNFFHKNNISFESISIREFNWESRLVNDSVIFINLIGKAHDHKGTATEHEYYDINYEFPKKIFKLFLQSNAKLLIHISSIAAIEELESKIPLTEDKVSNSMSWYGKSKRLAEEWLLSQNLPDGKKLIILRPPMIHGPGDKGNLRLLYKIVSRGIPYPLASFENKRSFLSIENFNYFIHQILIKGEGLKSGVYHISDDEPISTLQLIKIISDVTSKKVFNLFIPKEVVRFFAKIGDYLKLSLNSTRLIKMTGNLLVSNRKIKEMVGIDKLPISAEEGLIRTIQSFKKVEK